ncbi:Transcriptional regulator, MarR family [Caldisalinibacter kiritimatiensis]|uniref:Transcriptional regulator, MarR family n=2 Tax=Caldisalinibacter kiritimatiensis TaxID=1304284 RepID=R1CCG2_9FIRM|nr:Transcriptional regulator, MarR family [Caldisalinibacter kiritimatiensis]
MGTSRQNVKQLAVKLQQKGFLAIDKDKKDSRALRLKLTQKNQWFWKKREEKDRNFIINLFKNLSEEEVSVMYDVVNKLLDKVEEMGS